MEALVSMESALTPVTVYQVSQVTDVMKAKVGSFWFSLNKIKEQCPAAFQLA